MQGLRALRPRILAWLGRLGEGAVALVQTSALSMAPNADSAAAADSLLRWDIQDRSTHSPLFSRRDSVGCIELPPVATRDTTSCYSRLRELAADSIQPCSFPPNLACLLNVTARSRWPVVPCAQLQLDTLHKTSHCIARVRASCGSSAARAGSPFNCASLSATSWSCASGWTRCCRRCRSCTLPKIMR